MSSIVAAQARDSRSAHHGLFYASVSAGEPFFQLFEHIPGILFFAKDRNSRLMRASTALVRRLGLPSECELIGRSDYDFFPPHIAEGFIADDQTVQRTGKPLIDRVELWYTEDHILDWFVTTKLPLLDPRGQSTGVIGFMRCYEGKRRAVACCSKLLKVVDYISTHLDSSLAIAELAKVGWMSERNLQRRFREIFFMSTRQFVIKKRIQHAARAITDTDRSLSEIAGEFGFCDQSAFTHRFRLHTGLSPLKFRQRYRRGSLGGVKANTTQSAPSKFPPSTSGPEIRSHWNFGSSGESAGKKCI